MEKIEIKSEYIKLDQFLKWTGIFAMGSDAKEFILDGKVKVNGVVEDRRGKKLYPGDCVELLSKKYKIVAAIENIEE